MLLRLVSGGQTGADRAALDAALAAGFPCGGWCPSQRQAEDGSIPAHYPLQELNGGYSVRTLANVKDSDATLIVYRDSISGGTASTLRFCKQHQRPYLLIDSAQLDIQQAAAMIARFIAQHQVETLNVAGPRASGCPSIYAYTRDLLDRVIAHNQN
jgi:hypothetical protein